MLKLVKGDQIVENDKWIETNSIESAKSADKPLLSLELIQSAESETLDQLTYGILFSETDDFDSLKANLGSAEIIAFKFGKFADGRFFTFARELRLQHGFKGDIRAAGEFMPDQIAYLSRCGFSSFECRTEDEAKVAPKLKSIVSEAYQLDTINSEPLFRRK